MSASMYDASGPCPLARHMVGLPTASGVTTIAPAAVPRAGRSLTRSMSAACEPMPCNRRMRGAGRLVPGVAMRYPRSVPPTFNVCGAFGSPVPGVVLEQPGEGRAFASLPVIGTVPVIGVVAAAPDGAVDELVSVVPHA